MRVLVTGGAGFIGSHFVRRLAAAGDEVAVLDKLTYAGNRANLEGVEHEFHEGDIADPAAVGDAPPRAATRSSTSPPSLTSTARSSARPSSSSRMFSAPRCCSTTRVTPGSGWCRSRPTRSTATSPTARLPCTEDAPLRPSSPYSASKTGGDLQVLAYIRTYGVDACITRGANNYGPRQYPEKLIPLFITNAFEGKPLPVYGDGRQRREWLHADDYSSAIELVMRKAPSGEIYNVGGQESENMEVIRRILDLTGASPDLVRHVEDRPGHDRRYAVDSAKVRELGWAPAHNFKDGGLEETVAWYRENQAWWEPIKSGEYRAYYEEQYGKRLAG